MKPAIIQRFEYDTLRIGEEGFTEPHFERLTAFNDLHGNRFFVVGNRRIIFQNFVGVIQIGSLTIEILPKSDRFCSDKPKMRNLLIKMLHRIGALPIEKAETASLQKIPGTLFELYLRIFISELRGIIRCGIPKRYTPTQSNERFLRGRLLPAEQLKYNLIHQEYFFIAYQKFSVDHRFNQILKKALHLIAELPYAVADEAKTLLTFFDDVADRKISVQDFSRLKYTRNTECYRTAISIAELLIANYQPDLQFGSLNIMAMLFDMNLLFERYVAAELSRSAENCGKSVKIQTQTSKPFWHQNENGACKTIRPDILVDVDGKRFVLDTKWKFSDDSSPGDGDLKQLYAYSLQFNAEHVFLVYPSGNEEFQCNPGHFAESALHQKRQISQWKIPLLSGEKLNLELGKDMQKQLLQYIE